MCSFLYFPRVVLVTLVGIFDFCRCEALTGVCALMVWVSYDWVFFYTSWSFVSCCAFAMLLDGFCQVGILGMLTSYIWWKCFMFRSLFLQEAAVQTHGLLFSFLHGSVPVCLLPVVAYPENQFSPRLAQLGGVYGCGEGGRVRFYFS